MAADPKAPTGRDSGMRKSSLNPGESRLFKARARLCNIFPGLTRPGLSNLAPLGLKGNTVADRIPEQIGRHPARAACHLQMTLAGRRVRTYAESFKNPRRCVFSSAKFNQTRRFA